MRWKAPPLLAVVLLVMLVQSVFAGASTVVLAVEGMT